MTTETETVMDVLAEMRETATTGHTIESRGMIFAADPKWFDDWASRIQAAHARAAAKLVRDVEAYEQALAAESVNADALHARVMMLEEKEPT